jgi:hypothetical protein
MKFRSIILALIAAIALTNCEKQQCECDPPVEKGPLSLKFQLYKDGAPIAIQQKFADDSLEVMVERLKVYFSHIKLRKSSNNTLVSLTDVLLADISDPELTTFHYSTDQVGYSSILFGIGLDANQNQMDPATFPLDHPMSTFYGMHWGWAGLYKFMELQGRSNPDGQLGTPTDVAFSYHPGNDAFYKQYEMALNLTQGEDTSHVEVAIDYDTIFKGSAGDVNILTENQSHTTPSDYHIAEKIIFNFGEALTILVK